MIERYNNRFDITNYENDPECEIGLFDNALIENKSIVVSERILGRLISIGAAYELHVIPMFNLYDEVYFNEHQCENMIGELEFIEYVVNDDILRDFISEVKSIVLECVRANGRYALLVGGN